MKCLMLILGTRPEAIKLAPLVRELQGRPETFRVIVTTTGQHREMVARVLGFFGIGVEHDLGVMLPRQSLAALTARILIGIERVLEMENPDCVVVQGDTTTTLAGALAAFYARVPIAHVEAGLRTGNRRAPFPEELNRVIVGQLGTYHFAPTALAARNLAGEGVRENVWVVGNTGIDALLWGREILRSERGKSYVADLPTLDPRRRLILVTMHRRESYGARMAALCGTIKGIVAERDDVEFLLPVHPNPRVSDVVHTALGGIPAVHLTRPLDYPGLIAVLDRCHIVMTDSGGIQEEAPVLGKPVLVLREVTERVEGIEAGTARLVGTAPGAVHAEVTRLLDDRAAYQAMARAVSPYGDGLSSTRVADILVGVDLHQGAPDADPGSHA